MVKKSMFFVLAVGSIVACFSVGWADDFPATGYKWSGAYVGLNGGWTRGLSDAKTTTVFSPTGYFAQSSVPAIASAGSQSLENDNFTGGIQAGYNWQFGKAVIGGEMDFNYQGIDDSKSCTAGYPCCAPTTFTVESRVQTDWLFTVRPRIGFAMDKWLIYATGGLAVTNIKADFKFTDTFAGMYEAASVSETKAGWTVGGGIEMGIAKHWSIKSEYLYTDFGSISTTGRFSNSSFPGFVTVGANNPFNHSIDLRTHMVRIGINYLF
jgi:outer membrane immunogenic protein